jgi:TIR domain
MAFSSPVTPGRIFISYRRDETDFPAGWLYERLAAHFGPDQVFKDVDSIELGDDFAEVIASAVGACDVLLVLIGAHWLGITDENGRRRLENSDDFVRLEIEAALQRKVRIIPILVGRARMPDTDQLPASLGKLVRRQALELNPNRFEADTRRLVRVVEKTLAEEEARREAEARRAAATAPEQSTVQVSEEQQRQERPEEESRPVLPPAKFIASVPPVDATDTGDPTVPIETATPARSIDVPAGVRPARRLLLVAGLALAGLLVASGVAYLEYGRDGGKGVSGAAVAGAKTGPTATPSPTTPADELCSDDIKSNRRWVCLTSAVIAHGKLTIKYNVEYAGSKPDINKGYHLHIFGSDGKHPPDYTMSSHVPKSTRGKYYYEDRRPSVLDLKDSRFIEAIGDAPKVCARIAIPGHGLVPDNKGGYKTGNCVPITRT